MCCICINAHVLLSTSQTLAPNFPSNVIQVEVRHMMYLVRQPRPQKPLLAHGVNLETSFERS